MVSGSFSPCNCLASVFGSSSGTPTVRSGAVTFYSNDPLRRVLSQELEPDKIKVDLRVGAVSLVSGEYVEFRADSPNLVEAILASTVMPIIWTPVDVSPLYQAMVDGGVRNISPIGDVLETEPDEVVIINCSPEATDMLPDPPANIGKIGLRTLAEARL